MGAFLRNATARSLTRLLKNPVRVVGGGGVHVLSPTRGRFILSLARDGAAPIIGWNEPAEHLGGDGHAIPIWPGGAYSSGYGMGPGSSLTPDISDWQP